MASTADQGLLQSGPLDAHFPIGFKVWPRKIELKSFKTGKKYVTWLSVRNDTAAVRRVRILPPATSPFAIEYQEEGALISPGITTKVKVIFKSSDLVASYDTVRVVTGDSSSEQLDVPLSAFPPGPEIEFNKLVNLGVVITNATARKTFALRNMGEIPGKFTIESAKDDQLLFDKTEGQLAPKGEMGDMTNVSLEITATEAGEFRAVYKVKLDTVVGERVEILTVVGTVLEPSLTQTIPGQGPLDKVNFGDLYFGQTRVVRSHLVNNSPLATPFVITISSNEDMDDLNGEPDPYVSVFPAEGKLEPYTQIQISYVFQPQRLLQNKVNVSFFSVGNCLRSLFFSLFGSPIAVLFSALVAGFQVASVDRRLDCSVREECHHRLPQCGAVAYLPHLGQGGGAVDFTVAADSGVWQDHRQENGGLGLGHQEQERRFAHLFRL